MIGQVQKLLQDVGPGKMSSLAYDTAWAARLGEVDRVLSDNALDWLCENQLPDGSWGALKPFNYHDRLISTLAALIALRDRNGRSGFKSRFDKGLTALEKIAGNGSKDLHTDSQGATVAFEMIIPTLVAEAKQLGIIRQHATRILDPIAIQRKIKLDLIKGKPINRFLTASFSIEMAGKDGQNLLDSRNLQESNGSIGHSPSATAYYSLYVAPGDEKALMYLKTAMDSDGGLPDLLPFDVFEASWVLWNILLIKELDIDSDKYILPLITFLEDGWMPDRGIGLSVTYSIPDGDNTAFVYEVLSRYGRTKNLNPILTFEETEHFRTYHLEANSSISVNIHALGALRQAGLPIENPSIQKILKHLERTRAAGAYWYDKWNLSPYYPTCHAIIACSGYADSLIEPSIQWIIDTQHDDGSWGFFFPTAEETAYSLQAMTIWKSRGGVFPKSILKKAFDWLIDHIEPPYPPLWIGKGLYSPELVVKSAILSALLMNRSG
jgi:halimadienyl-diphosphate synthase